MVTVSITRAKAFEASHRYYNPAFSEEENGRIFGECYNRFGHGHNYEHDVSIAGPVDQSTRTIADLLVLDAAVKEAALDPFDHKHLNHEVSHFASLNPTSENVVRVVWDLLKPKTLFARLERVVLSETQKSYFECSGE